MSSKKIERPDDHVVAKWTTFWGMYLGYTLAIINRKSFSFALPAIMENLHLDKNEVGLISSSQNLAYTISKFFSGILCDRVNVKYLFAFGLFGSGLLTVSLSAFRSAAMFAIILFLQGFFQGGGWPACAKILKGWSHPSLFGCVWGVLSTAMNLACALGPIVTGILLQYYPWQSCFVFYGMLVILRKIFSSSEFATKYGLLNTAMNVAGCTGPIVVAMVVAYHAWPAVFVFSGIAAVLGSLLSFVMIDWPIPKALNQEKTSSNQMQGRGTWKDLMRSPLMWVICFSYFMVFMGRTAALEWGQLYLIQELKHNQHIGSLFISCMEIGGVLGSLTSGYLADIMVTRSKNTLHGSPRMTVTTIFVCIFVVALHCFLFLMNTNSSDVFIMAIGFFMGIGVYGPISLYGVMAIEASPVHLQGTSHAIVSLAANFGAITAGLPFSIVAQELNWRGAFIIFESLLILTIVLKVLTRNLKYKMVDTKKKMQ